MSESSGICYGACLTECEADALHRFLEDDRNEPYWEGPDAKWLQSAQRKLQPRNRLNPIHHLTDAEARSA